MVIITASNAWSVSCSTVTDSETDNDTGRRAAGGPRTDYQADPNTNIYTTHGPSINKLTSRVDPIRADFKEEMKRLRK